jgi:hypothetical protein
MHQGMAIRERLSWQPTGRLLLIVFAALALLMQSYAVQSHFHELSRTAGTASIQMAGQTGKHHLPVGNDDPDNCLLCHSLYSGQYIAPSLAAWFLLIVAVSIIAATSGVSPHYDTVSHSWRGRGPPHN